LASPLLSARVFGSQDCIPSTHIYEALDNHSRLHDLTAINIRRHGRLPSSPAATIHQTGSPWTWRVSRKHRPFCTKKYAILESTRSVFAHMPSPQHCKRQPERTHKQSYCLVTTPGAPVFGCARVPASQQTLFGNIKLHDRFWIRTQELCWPMATRKDNRPGRLLYCSLGQTQRHWSDWCRKDHFQEDGRDGSCSKLSKSRRDAR
jgi:hypothetical protein